MENQKTQPTTQLTTSSKFTLPVLIAILILLVGIVGYYLGTRHPQPSVITVSPTPTVQQICTREVRACPDGTEVGRTGPNCEFAACPVTSISQLPSPQATQTTTATSSWRTYESVEGRFSVKLPPAWHETLCNDFTKDTFPNAVLNINFQGAKTQCGIGAGEDIQIKFVMADELNSSMNYYEQNYNTQTDNVKIGNKNAKKFILVSKKNNQAMEGSEGDDSGRTTFIVEHKPSKEEDKYQYLEIIVNTKDNTRLVDFLPSFNFLN